MGLGHDFSKFPTRGIALLLVGAGLFATGWWLGQREQDRPAEPAPTPSGEVELRLDAGGVKLVPDGGLHLEPMERLEPEDLEAPP